MKTTLLILSTLLMNASMSFALGGASTGGDSVGQALIVSVTGKYMSPNMIDVRTVSHLIGRLTEELKLKTIEFRGYGDEGGFIVCLEPSPFVESWPDIVAKFGDIKVNVTETLYSVEGAASCRSQAPAK